jgi:predicted Zn finger-like uncharacterized protein
MVSISRGGRAVVLSAAEGKQGTKMASELVSCPECTRKLRVPADLIGKLVKCPTCGHTFTADPEKQAPKPEPATVPQEDKPARTSKVGRSDDDDDRPVSRRSSRDDDDDDEDRSRRRRRSRSRRDDDDDDDERPRRRRSRSSRDDDDDDDDDYRSRRRDLMPHRAGAVLTIGILSFFFFPLILGPIAWVMGNNDLAAMRAGLMDREGESQTNAGRICGMISTILGAVIIVGFFGCCLCPGIFSAGGGGGRGRF